MQKLKRVATALVAVFLCLNAAQAETSLKLGGWSIHTTSEAPNSFHRVAIVSHNDYFGGYFRNSFNDDSMAVGKSFHKVDRGVTFSMHAGLVYGYRKSTNCYKATPSEGNKIVCPMLAPEMTLTGLPLKPSLALFGLDALVLTLNLSLGSN